MNKNNLFKSIISIGYGILFMYLIISRNILKYVHPRIEKFVFFSAIILIIAGIYNLKNLKKSIYMKYNKLTYSIFLIPFISGLFIDPTELTNLISSSKGMTLEQVISSKKNIDILDKEGNIKINEENYIDALSEIYSDIEKYKGKNIEIDGFVFRNDSMKQNQFLVARNVITCCIADAGLFGYLLESDNLDNIPDNTWILVKGKLRKIEFHGDYVPGIEVKKEGISFPMRPKNEYIFAN